MSRRSTPSSDEVRDDLDFNQLSFDNELGRQLARVQRRRAGGQQRSLSERLAEHNVPLPVGVRPFSFRQSIPGPLAGSLAAGHGNRGHAAGAGRGRRDVQYRHFPEFGRTQRHVHPRRGQTLPSPPFSPQQIAVMERILRSEVPAAQIDDVLDSVGLVHNQLMDYMA